MIFAPQAGQQIEGSRYDPLLVLVSIAANTKKPDELQLQAAGIACKYVHAALSSATVSTLHKTVDSGARWRSLTRAWSAWRLSSTQSPEPEQEPPVQASEPEEKPSEQPPKLILSRSEHYCGSAGLAAASLRAELLGGMSLTRWLRCHMPGVSGRGPSSSRHLGTGAFGSTWADVAAERRELWLSISVAR